MKKNGNQTPTKSVILDYDKTLGHEAVELYKKNWKKSLSLAREDDKWPLYYERRRPMDSF